MRTTTRRRTTTWAAAGATVAALCALAIAPAAAAVPGGWESAALGLPAAQRLSTGKGVTVAVLDTGVVADHADLKGHVTTGPDYVGDIAATSDPGWGVHGTAMASAVLKVAPDAGILSVRVIDEKEHKADTARSGTSPVAKGVEYAVKHGADVIVLSLGDSGQLTQDHNSAEAQTIGYAVSNGVPVVAAAGNSGGGDNSGAYPAGYPTVISVAGTGKDGRHAPHSTVRTYNAVAAPAVGVTMAKNTGGHTVADGTSASAALASGVVALMLADHPKLTPAQVRSVLTSTAHHPAGGHDALVGYGLIDAAAAVRGAASAPADRTAAVADTGRAHLGTPEGTSRTVHAPMEQDIWLGGLGAAGAGLLMLAGVAVAARRARGRRATQF
ncbi:S8 family serine peptidase [Streptomyces sp. NPDC102467]|uniref:S8 family serine peptidase n=1 Tax=Streptomyces sp. NPDC102467 TaxID=3366179 RepID=UPI00380E6E8C